MALYECTVCGEGVSSILKKITVAQKWTATGWNSDIPKTGSQSFTTEKKGMYILTSGGSCLNNSLSKITCQTFTALCSEVAPVPLNYSENTNAHATAFYKICDAGETHTFDWSVTTWNRIGGLEVTLLFISL